MRLSKALLGKIADKASNILTNPLKHKYNIFKNQCNICKRNTLFVCTDPSEIYIRQCMFCRSTPKYRALYAVIEKIFGDNFVDKLSAGEIDVFEMSTTSAIHKSLYKYDNYICSGYFYDMEMGKKIKNRTYNQDIQNMSFMNNSFDLVISSETMEHVPNPILGFTEIYRILKPGGVHCFTIPYHANAKTIKRSEITDNKIVNILPEILHQDPYCKEGSLVFTDFGNDIIDILRTVGFETVEHNIINAKNDIHDDLKPMRAFCSKKIEQISTRT